MANDLTKIPAIPVVPTTAVENALRAHTQRKRVVVVDVPPEPQGLIDKILHGAHKPLQMTKVIDMTDLDIASEAVAIQQLDKDSSKLNHEKHLDFLRAFRDGIGVETQYKSLLKTSRALDIDLINLSHQIDAAQQLYPEKEAAALIDVQTERIDAETRLLEAQRRNAEAQQRFTTSRIAAKNAALQENEIDDLLAVAEAEVGFNRAASATRKMTLRAQAQERQALAEKRVQERLQRAEEQARERERREAEEASVRGKHATADDAQLVAEANAIVEDVEQKYILHDAAHTHHATAALLYWGDLGRGASHAEAHAHAFESIKLRLKRNPIQPREAYEAMQHWKIFDAQEQAKAERAAHAAKAAAEREKEVRLAELQTRQAEAALAASRLDQDTFGGGDLGDDED